MNLDNFVAKYTGKGIDYDGVYGFQCMDLMHQYIYEVLGLTDSKILAAPSAKDVYLNFDSIFGKENFELIANTPTNVPQKGDIMFWGPNLGPYGHVAIFLSGDANSFDSFDQNFPTGSTCHIQKHSYNAVLGWLRPKNVNVVQSNPMPPYLVQLFAEQKLDPQNEGAVRELFGHAKDYISLKQDLASCQAALTLQISENATLHTENTQLKDQTTDLETKLLKTQNDLLNANLPKDDSATSIPVVVTFPTGFWAKIRALLHLPQ